jgi:hypothetical protein
MGLRDIKSYDCQVAEISNKFYLLEGNMYYLWIVYSDIFLMCQIMSI